MARNSPRYVDSTGVSIGEYTGAKLTASKGGDRLASTLEFPPMSARNAPAERAALISFLVGLRGRQNRAYLFDPAYRRRGSFPASELLANNTFAAGTSGWTVSGSITQSVMDRVLRLTRTDGVTTSSLRKSGALSCVQYAPYCLRAFITQGRGGINTGIRLGTSAGASDMNFSSGTVTTPGMITAAGVTQIAAPFFSLVNGFSGSSISAGSYFDIPYISMARCGLVDNASNTLLRSREFNNASWTATRATVTANSIAAPDASTSADSIVEDGTASQTHYVNQTVTVSSAAGWQCLAVALKAGTRTWARLMMRDGTDAQDATCYFNLSTGALGSTSAGTAWEHVRGVSMPMGDGWYYCALIGRKINAATSINCFLHIAQSNGTVTYSGDGSSNIYAWEATQSPSGVPMRLTTSSAATVPDTPQTGSLLFTKGLPASENGLLVPGDQFAVVTSRGHELKIVTASLNSDAAGMGCLQFEPPLRGAPADNAPVITDQPMGRFIYAGQSVGWDNDPGIITRASVEFEEAA